MATSSLWPGRALDNKEANTQFVRESFKGPRAPGDGPRRGPGRWESQMEKLAVWTSVALDRLSTLREERGQGLVEYGLILFLVSVVAVVALTNIGKSVSSVLSKVATDI
jgi:pilus assembly protein Flp/PilA